MSLAMNDRDAVIRPLVEALVPLDVVESAVDYLMDAIADLLKENAIVYGVFAQDGNMRPVCYGDRVPQFIFCATRERFDCRMLGTHEKTQYAVDWAADPWGYYLQVLVADEPHIASVVMSAEQYIYALYAKEKLP